MNGDLAFGAITGALAMGYAIVGLFFLRFWTQARDQLFLSFAIAFWLMAANQVVPLLFRSRDSDQGGAYLLRLAAFGLILFAILRQNARPPDRS